MVGSLLIFAGKDISYVDALFFSTGAATQSGLNPIDVNLLNTWQQVFSHEPLPSRRQNSSNKR
jgi:hypothetical protein